MHLRVNSEDKMVDSVRSLEDLLNCLGYRQRTGIAVALNGSVVPKSDWRDQKVAEGDAIAIVQAVQGG